MSSVALIILKLSHYFYSLRPCAVVPPGGPNAHQNLEKLVFQKSEKIRKNPKKSENIRKNPKKSEKIRKNPKKSEKIRKNPKIYETQLILKIKEIVFPDFGL